MWLIVIVPLFIAVCADQACAHLIRLVMDAERIVVKRPEVSQAFYGQLNQGRDVFEITADDEFVLYVNLLVPAEQGIDTSVCAVVREVQQGKDRVLTIIDGSHESWEGFYEPFAGDHYLRGPEFEREVGAGRYVVEVSGAAQSRYVLAIGSREEFSVAEIMRMIAVLPALKRDFFGNSPLTAYFNVVGLFMLVTVLVIAGGVVAVIKLVYRLRVRNHS